MEIQKKTSSVKKPNEAKIIHLNCNIFFKHFSACALTYYNMTVLELKYTKFSQTIYFKQLHLLV